MKHLNEICWLGADKNVEYADALKKQEAYVESILAGEPQAVWLLEHPHLYTAGTSAQSQDLLDKEKIPVYEAGRGGQYTYHGPGQRVAYVMLDLNNYNKDLRAHIWRLEEWIIRSIADFGIKGERREGRVGIWVAHDDGSEDKIAAIGVRVRRWVSFHGIAINVHPDLSYYNGIVPCGIANHGVTSFEKLGVLASLEDLDNSLKHHFTKVF
ncbi:MAG: lipoyl(octanoyl) transferase LipB [Alphaproteobacteria bacterium]